MPIQYTPQLSAVAADITTIKVDVIVNAANPQLVGGSGVDGAIHRAGGPTILEEGQAWVREYGSLPTGEAMITGAGALPALRVIHTVGPIWAEHDAQSAERLLANCYRNSLQLAATHGCRSIAFPSISTGVYGYPKDDAAGIAVANVCAWIGEHPAPEKIIFVCFDEMNLAIYEELLGSESSV